MAFDQHTLSDHYDAVVIGTGAGGGTLAYRLAQTGKRILILERGSFVPREKENWDTNVVFNTDRYHHPEIWYTPEGEEIHPGMSYAVGGNTKVYGAALFRLRERDFEAVPHKDGISPEWPLKYHDLEPYYTQAEELYQVHGRQGLDPTEPPRQADYPYAPVSHEPRIQEVHDQLKAKGYHPYYTPLGIHLNETQMFLSECIRCSTCDGFPCLVHAKSDAEVTGILPILHQKTVTLLTGARVLKLHSSESGREITSVEFEHHGQIKQVSGAIVAVCCGSINSSALLLRSANDRHPKGLANSSDRVGRNVMKHVLGSIIGVTKHPNPTQFQKSLSVNDFYWGEQDYDYPMGQIQLLGKVNKDMLMGAADQYKPLEVEYVASHSVDWWLTTEDLPDPNNRVTLQGERLQLHYQENNTEPFERLMGRWQGILQEIDCGEHLLPNCSYFVKGGKTYFTGKLPLDGVGHQVGTCVFGEDPQTSVLDLNCRTHDVDNLYVVDGSFFPSSGAVNPTLTIIANALRVGDHLAERLS